MTAATLPKPAPKLSGITIDRDVFAFALSRAALGASVKSTIPVMQCVKIEQRKDSLRLTTSNFDRWLVICVANEGPESAAFCLPAKRLLDIVTALPPGEITVRPNANGTRVLVMASRSRYELSAFAPDEFPTEKPSGFTEKITIAGRVLADALGWTVQHSSRELSRPTMQGVCLDSAPDGLSLVATDGYRMCRVRLGAQIELNHGDWIIPRESVGAVVKLFGEAEQVTIAASEGYVRLTAPGVSLALRLIEGPFPQYRILLAQDRPKIATMDRVALLAAVNRARALGDDVGVLSFAWTKTALTISAAQNDVGVTEDVVPCRYVGEPFTVGLNPAFCADALGVLAGNDLTIRMRSLNDGVSFETSDDPALAIVQPKRIIAPPVAISPEEN